MISLLLLLLYFFLLFPVFFPFSFCVLVIFVIFFFYYCHYFCFTYPFPRMFHFSIYISVHTTKLLSYSLCEYLMPTLPSFFLGWGYRSKNGCFCLYPNHLLQKNFCQKHSYKGASSKIDCKLANMKFIFVNSIIFYLVILEIT